MESALTVLIVSCSKSIFWRNKISIDCLNLRISLAEATGLLLIASDLVMWRFKFLQEHGQESVWAQCRCSSTWPMTLENVLLDISKTLTALSNSDCLVLSGSWWSCWVFQTEVPVPCGCPRSAEAGGRLWWISWGTGAPTQASGLN